MSTGGSDLPLDAGSRAALHRDGVPHSAELTPLVTAEDTIRLPMM